mgnify:CR=1 FL=1
MVITFEAEREGYTRGQVSAPLTVGELKRFLDDYSDDTLIFLSHDRGYTFGTLRLEEVEESWRVEDDD